MQQGHRDRAISYGRDPNDQNCWSTSSEAAFRLSLRPQLGVRRHFLASLGHRLRSRGTSLTAYRRLSPDQHGRSNDCVRQPFGGLACASTASDCHTEASWTSHTLGPEQTSQDCLVSGLPLSQSQGESPRETTRRRTQRADPRLWLYLARLTVLQGPTSLCTVYQARQAVDLYLRDPGRRA